MDEVVTHADVLRWLPTDVQRELTMAMPPEQRGWYTREEADRDGGRFVELGTAECAETWFVRRA